jgi:hypothetical protein
MAGDWKQAFSSEKCATSLAFPALDIRKHVANCAGYPGTVYWSAEVQVLRLQLGWMPCTALDSLLCEHIIHLLNVGDGLIALNKGRYAARAYGFTYSKRSSPDTGSRLPRNAPDCWTDGNGTKIL